MQQLISSFKGLVGLYQKAYKRPREGHCKVFSDRETSAYRFINYYGKRTIC